MRSFSDPPKQGERNSIEFSILKGQTLCDIEKFSKDDNDSEMVRFISMTGRVFEMYHDQDCCESVMLDDVVGDLSDLIGHPLQMAEEASFVEWPEGVAPSDYEDESFLWTFYKLATINGYVTLRWYGCSNGYYSEEVSFYEVT